MSKSHRTTSRGWLWLAVYTDFLHFSMFQHVELRPLRCVSREIRAVVANPAVRTLGERPHSFARVGCWCVQDDVETRRPLICMSLSKLEHSCAISRGSADQVQRSTEPDAISEASTQKTEAQQQSRTLRGRRRLHGRVLFQ